MKRFLMLALTVATVFATTSAMALTIVGSAHDLQSAGTSAFKGVAGESADEICVYCHTPHNAQEAVPLWNRNAPTAVLNYANAAGSATLDHTLGAVSVTSISGKCLSCHDGSISPSAVANARVTDSGVAITVASAAFLDNLDNDHPVAFVYSSGLDKDGPAGISSLDTIANATADGIQFFGAADNEVECASCHKVHDDAITPFLRTSNAASALCLACHIK